MKNKLLRGGVVGFGKMGMLHSAIINVSKQAFLIAVSETNKQIRETVEEFLPQTHVYADYKRMLTQEKLDFVFITTPSFSHPEIALDCIRHNCHFFVEKPLALKAASCFKLLSALNKKPLITAVGYMMRYLETFSLAKKIIKQKILRKIFSFRATSYVSQLFISGKGWRYQPEKAGGGALITQGIHTLDLIYWLFDLPSRLNAQMNSFYSRKVEDFIQIIFEWKEGIIGLMDCSWSVDGHRLLEIDFQITGENGTLRVNEDNIQLYLKKKNDLFPVGWTIKTKAQLYNGVNLDIGGAQYTKEDEAFFEAVRQKKELGNNVWQAYQVQKMVDAIYESAHKDRKTIILK